MAPATIYPGATISDRSNTLQGRDLLSLFLGTGIQTTGYARAIEDHFDKIYRVEDTIYGYRSLTASHAMTTIANRPEVGWLVQMEATITALLSDLRDLLKEEDEDGILKPSYYAFTTALNLIIEAAMLLRFRFPFAAVSTDNEGGIRIEWVKNEGEIRLVIPASDNNVPYIYYEFGDQYGVDRNADAMKLARWINRLNSYGTITASAYFSTATL